LLTLENEYLRVSISDYAGTLVALETRDRHGKREHVVLGFDDIESYVAAGGSFGALLGRTANRIGGGHVTIDGRSYQLSRNENGNTLHGGKRGFDRRFWDVAQYGEAGLHLTITSVDGDQGFPGDVSVTAIYRLEGTSLSLTFEAETGAPTPLSLSSHPYFNLDGSAARDCLDHEIEIPADAFLPTDQKQLPTGEIRSVTGTPFDFRAPRRIGARIRELDPQLRFGRGYDHYFVLPDPAEGARLRTAARARSAFSGRILEIATTQRGVQFYTGNNIDGSLPGRNGLYRQSAGFAVEPQGFPDAVHHPNFPSTILHPGQHYREETVYRFSTDMIEAGS
jgi:aldose 1-epimerase